MCFYFRTSFCKIKRVPFDKISLSVLSCLSNLYLDFSTKPDDQIYCFVFPAAYTVAFYIKFVNKHLLYPRIFLQLHILIYAVLFLQHFPVLEHYYARIRYFQWFPLKTLKYVFMAVSRQIID